jgi:lactoylglutathione lyase
MRIEYVAMYVTDLEGMKEFYCKFFHAKSSGQYYNSKTEMKTYFLTFDSGAKLKLMYKVERQLDMHKQIRTGYSNLSFHVKDREEVDQMAIALENAKFEILSGPRMTDEGFYECAIKDPEWNQIEIIA